MTIASVRRRVRDARKTRLAFLGDERGAVDVAGTSDQCWVRFVEGADANGVQQLSAPVAVRVGNGVNYINAWGAAVRVGRDDYGRWEVKRNDPLWLAERQISPRVLNAVRPEMQFVALQQLSLFRSFPVGTADQPSNAVTLYPLLYELDGVVRFWRGTEQNKIDLSLFYPPAGSQRLALVCYNVVEEQPTVFASVPQDVDDAIDLSDLDECVAQKTDDDVPSTAFVLRGGEPLNSKSFGFDARQLINMPQLIGDPDTISRPIRIHPNRVLTRSDVLVINSRLVVEGRVLVLGKEAGGGGGGGLAVQEADGSPNVSGVQRIIVPNSTLTDLGAGTVQLSIGAPSAKFILTESSPTVPTGIVIPGLGGSADVARTTGGIVEEYDTSATNLTWTNAPTTVSSNVIPSHLYVRVSGGATYGERPWSTSGDFDARTKISAGAALTQTNGDFYEVYLSVSNASRSQGVLCGILAIRANGFWAARYRALRWTGSSYTGVEHEFRESAPPMYFRIARTGGAIESYFSHDGLAWTQINSVAYTLTVERIGYLVGRWGLPWVEFVSDWLWTSV